jgi:hypothetical protein
MLMTEKERVLGQQIVELEKTLKIQHQYITTLEAQIETMRRLH